MTIESEDIYTGGAMRKSGILRLNTFCGLIGEMV